MKLAKFCIYTVIGAALWNAFLTIVGYYLRDNWLTVRKYGEIADVIVVVLLIAAIVFFIFQYRKRSRERNGDSKQAE